MPAETRRVTAVLASEPFGSRVYFMELPDSDMGLYCGLQHHVEDQAQHTLLRIGVHLRALQTEWQQKTHT